MHGSFHHLPGHHFIINYGFLLTELSNDPVYVHLTSRVQPKYRLTACTISLLRTPNCCAYYTTESTSQEHPNPNYCRNTYHPNYHPN